MGGDESGARPCPRLLPGTRRPGVPFRGEGCHRAGSRKVSRRLFIALSSANIGQVPPPFWLLGDGHPATRVRRTRHLSFPSVPPAAASEAISTCCYQCLRKSSRCTPSVRA